MRKSIKHQGALGTAPYLLNAKGRGCVGQAILLRQSTTENGRAGRGDSAPYLFQIFQKIFWFVGQATWFVAPYRGT